MKPGKITFYDWLAIQILRRKEQSGELCVRQEPIVEMERDRNGRIQKPLSFFKARANLILQDRLGFTSKELAGYVQWINRIVFFLIILCGIVFIPLLREKSLLNDVYVNLAGYFFQFLGLQILLCVLAVLGLILAIGTNFWRTIRGKPLSFGWFDRWGVWCVRGIVSLFFRLLLGLNKLVEKIFFTSSPEKEPRPLSGTILNELKAIFLENDNFLLKRGKYLWHWFWFSASLMTLFLLSCQMHSHLYNYCWNNSLLGSRTVRYIVDMSAWSVRWLGCEIPDDKDIAWLFDNSKNYLAKTIDNPRYIATQTRESSFDRDTLFLTAAYSEFRQRWSWFLLSIVFVWCVIPRFLFVLGFSGVLGAGGWKKTFKPNLKDPYFENILIQEERFLTTTESQVIEDDFTDDFLSQKPPGRYLNEGKQEPAHYRSNTAGILMTSPGSAPVTNSRDTDLKASVAVGCDEDLSSLSDVSGKNRPDGDSKVPENQNHVSIQEIPSQITPPRMNYTLAFDYETETGGLFWREIFPEPNALLSFGNVAGNREERRLLFQCLDEYYSEIKRVAFLTDCSIPPARQSVLFLQETVFEKLPQVPCVVILSCGEKLRKKLEPESVEQRLNDWRNTIRGMAQKYNTPVDLVFWDHELNLASAKQKLRERLNQDTECQSPLELSNGGGSVDENRKTGELSKAFDASIQLVRKAVESSLTSMGELLPGTFDDIDESRELSFWMELHQGIFRIYQEEPLISANSVNGLTGSGKSISDLLKLPGEWTKRFSNSMGQAIPAVPISTMIKKGTEQYSFSPEELKNKMIPMVTALEKMKKFCSRLSPQGAVIMGTLGASVPLITALAPVVAGGVTLSSVAALAGSIGTIFPSLAISGITGGMIGSLIPPSMAACRDKIKEQWKKRFTSSENSVGKNAVLNGKTADCVPPFSANRNNLSEEEWDYLLTRLHPPVYSALVWICVLELQGNAEDDIVTGLPLIMEPVEESAWGSLEEFEQMVEEVKKRLNHFQFG